MQIVRKCSKIIIGKIVVLHWNTTYGTTDGHRRRSGRGTTNVANLSAVASVTRVHGTMRGTYQTLLAVIAVATKTISLFVDGTVVSDTKVRLPALHRTVVAPQGTLALVHSVHSTVAIVVVGGVVLHAHASSMRSPGLIWLLVSVVIPKVLVLLHRVVAFRARTMGDKARLVVCLVVVIGSGQRARAWLGL